MLALSNIRAIYVASLHRNRGGMRWGLRDEQLSMFASLVESRNLGLRRSMYLRDETPISETGIRILPVLGDSRPEVLVKWAKIFGRQGIPTIWLTTLENWETLDPLERGFVRGHGVHAVIGSPHNLDRYPLDELEQKLQILARKQRRNQLLLALHSDKPLRSDGNSQIVAEKALEAGIKIQFRDAVSRSNPHRGLEGAVTAIDEIPVSTNVDLPDFVGAVQNGRSWNLTKEAIKLSGYKVLDRLKSSWPGK